MSASLVRPFRQPQHLHERGRARRFKLGIRGDCFRYAWYEAAAYIEAGQPRPRVRIAHGAVWTNTFGFVAHAWVERGDFAYDWQTLALDHADPVRVDAFYREKRPQNVKVYSPRALLAMHVHDHYGPYHDLPID